MGFPSVPLYLDPSNWQQQQVCHVGNNESPKVGGLLTGGSSSGGLLRPGSMADRARLARIPQPEAGLKCPRCDSTKTKFCYFNNYSLSQPRHFCKACRRYWTRGGALRNVPVGGGCRRNKKTKPIQAHAVSKALNKEFSGSKSPTHSSHLPFLASLNNFSNFQTGNVGLNFSGLGNDLGFHLGSSSSLMSNDNHVPFFDSQASFFPFGCGAFETTSDSTRVSGQVPLVKTENDQRARLLTPPENNQYWANNGFSWSDVSGLNSSSANQLL